MNKKKIKLDKEEQEIEDSFNEWKSSQNIKKEVSIVKKAAKNYFNKNNRINIRIAGADLNILKRIAAQEGIPYQTFISSVLHKYASGRLTGS